MAPDSLTPAVDSDPGESEYWDTLIEGWRVNQPHVDSKHSAEVADWKRWLAKQERIAEQERMAEDWTPQHLTASAHSSVERERISRNGRAKTFPSGHPLPYLLRGGKIRFPGRVLRPQSGERDRFIREVRRRIEHALTVGSASQLQMLLGAETTRFLRTTQEELLAFDPHGSGWDRFSRQDPLFATRLFRVTPKGATVDLTRGSGFETFLDLLRAFPSTERARYVFGVGVDPDLVNQVEFALGQIASPFVQTNSGNHTRAGYLAQVHRWTLAAQSVDWAAILARNKHRPSQAKQLAFLASFKR